MVEHHFVDHHSSFMFLLGGMAFFLYGMTKASESMQNLGANHVRTLLNTLSNKKFFSVVIGVALTVILQSSGAVTSILVGLGTARIIAISQVMGVILGTAIGSTLTVQLLSFKVAEYGLGIFLIAFVVHFVSQQRKVKELSGIFMGFGLLFFGLELMNHGTESLRENSFFVETLKGLDPMMIVVLSALFTGLIQSSAATIGLAMSLAGSGMIDLYTAMFWVYGANIGTTSTALIASIGGNHVGRQVAWAHFFFKFSSVLIFYLLTRDFVDILTATIGSSSIRDIANAHTLFNVMSALIFFPFIGISVKWIERMFPPLPGDEKFKTKFLTSEFENVALVEAQAKRETMRMGDIVMSMVKDSIDLFRGDDLELQSSIKERDNQVDLLHREIKMHIVNANRKGILDKPMLSLIDYISDLENAADVIDSGIMELSRKKENLKLNFSAEGWREIQEVHQLTVDITKISLSAFQLKDEKLANEAIDKKRRLRKLERDLRESHIDRLNKGLKESLNTSSIHLDLLSDYRRVAGLICNHCYVIANLR